MRGIGSMRRICIVAYLHSPYPHPSNFVVAIGGAPPGRVVLGGIRPSLQSYEHSWITHGAARQGQFAPSRCLGFRFQRGAFLFHEGRGCRTDEQHRTEECKMRRSLVMTLGFIGVLATTASSDAARLILVAGGGTGGDGSPARSAKLDGPFGVAFDRSGTIYFVEIAGNKA